MNVLIIDDEEDVLEVYTAFLEGSSIRVSTASDSCAAFVLASGDKFDAIISDLHMPNTFPSTFIQGLKAKCPEAKIIVCSGMDVSPTIEAMADDILPKPFSSEQLFSVLESPRSRVA